MNAPLEKEIREVCNEMAEFLIAKNAAYGNSAAEPVGIFAKRLDTLAQIDVRIDDKLNRLQKGYEYPGDDTVRDLAGYLLLRMVVSVLESEKVIDEIDGLSIEKIFMKAFLVNGVEGKRSLIKELEPVPVYVEKERLSHISWYAFDIFPSVDLVPHESNPADILIGRTLNVEITSVFDNHEWVRALLFNSEKDHADVMESLS